MVEPVQIRLVIGDPFLDGLPRWLDGLHGLDVERWGAGTGVTDPDSDDDGLQDGVETNTGVFASSTDTGTDPLDPDSDDDGLNDGVETNTGVFIGATDTGTDPHDLDSDGDLFNDFFEVERGFDPTDPTSRPPVPPDAILFENFEGIGADGISPNSSFALSSCGAAPAWVVDAGGSNFSVLRITHLVRDSINSAAWDAVDLPAEFEFSFVFRMSDDAANTGCCGEAADGFGFGFFDTTIYGESGPNNPGVGAQWEDPTAAAGFPGALFFGFDIFQANNVRVTGMGGSADVIRDDPFPFTINDSVFHGVRVSIAGSGEDTVLSLVMIEDILGASTEHAVFSEVVVAGLDLSAVRTRLIMGGRTGSAFVETDFDCILISGSAGPFQITEVVHDEDARVLTVTWQSREGSEYTVDSSTNMADPDAWNELDDAVPGARGSNRTSFDVPIPDGATRMFVRVRESR